jgi:hypothetical protein
VRGLSYPKWMREEAKRRGCGLVTVAWTAPNGASTITQLLAGPNRLRAVQRQEERLHAPSFVPAGKRRRR